jgi:hypothetical protein
LQSGFCVPVHASPDPDDAPPHVQSSAGSGQVSPAPQVDVSQRHPVPATQSGAIDAFGHASPVPPGATVRLHTQSPLPLHVSLVPQVDDESPQRQPIPAKQSGEAPMHASPVGWVKPLQLQSPPGPVHVSFVPHRAAWQRQPTPVTQSGAVVLLFGHASPVPPGATVALHKQSPLPLQVSFVPQTVDESPQRQPTPAKQSGVVPMQASPVACVVPLQLQSPPGPVHVSFTPQTAA